MLRTLVCLLISLSLILPSQAALLKDDKPQIIVAGKGIVKAKADVAYLMLGVERTETTATEAQQIAAQKMNNILASLQKMGIPKDKIETTDIILSPKYEYDKGKRALAGYTARNEIKVTIEKLEDIGKIIDTTLAAGATNISDIIFSVKDESPFKTAVLQKAFKDAESKAETIAAASGLVLSKIKRIQEAEAQVIRPLSGMRTFAAKAEAAETPVIPGKVEIRGYLTVVYECSVKK